MYRMRYISDDKTAPSSFRDDAEALNRGTEIANRLEKPVLNSDRSKSQTRPCDRIWGSFEPVDPATLFGLQASVSMPQKIWMTMPSYR